MRKTPLTVPQLSAANISRPGTSLGYSIVESSDKSLTFSIHELPRVVSKDWWVKK